MFPSELVSVPAKRVPPCREFVRLSQHAYCFYCEFPIIFGLSNCWLGLIAADFCRGRLGLNTKYRQTFSRAAVCVEWLSAVG